jgi:hypothetical protein
MAIVRHQSEKEHTQKDRARNEPWNTIDAAITSTMFIFFQ